MTSLCILPQVRQDCVVERRLTVILYHDHQLTSTQSHVVLASMVVAKLAIPFSIFPASVGGDDKGPTANHGCSSCLPHPTVSRLDTAT